MATFDLYLASSSPRRRDLLLQLGVRTRVLSAAVDETPLVHEAAQDYVVRMATAKARAGQQRIASGAPMLPVLGADTAVVKGQALLGKPTDAEAAASMLAQLSGSTHWVLSAVAVLHQARMLTAVSATEVTFAALTPQQISAYCATGEPDDKAGGYGIQGFAAAFVTRIAGSYSGVVGLPLAETAQLLDKFHVPVWQADAAVTSGGGGCE